MQKLTNWAGNYQYRAANIHQPETVAHIQALVQNSPKVKALGSRHSFNDIADTTAALLSLEKFNQILALDAERRTVTIQSGVRYGELGRHLHQHGYALHNLASLPHISVAGAVATATHGSGVCNANLATAVCGLEMVLADGTVHTYSREHDGEAFQGMVVGLGALGVVTQLTLDIVPTFDVRQDVYENLPLAQLENHFDAILSSAYSVSLFTDWQSDRFNQVWIKSRVPAELSGTPDGSSNTITLGGGPERGLPEWFEATRATRPLHPIPGAAVHNCTEQLGVPGPWNERLPHFRMEDIPSSGEELQAEYLLPREHGLAALNVVYQLRERIAPLLLISEVRTVAADTLWMSPCYQQDCIAIHFTWKPDWPAVQALMPVLEARLAPFQARPHWGKLFAMQAAQVRPLYPKLPDFLRLLQACDPTGKFRNEFLDTRLLGADA